MEHSSPDTKPPIPTIVFESGDDTDGSQDKFHGSTSTLNSAHSGGGHHLDVTGETTSIASSTSDGGAKSKIMRRSSSHGRLSISDEAKRLTNRASQLIVKVPLRQLKTIAHSQGISSLSRETQHFVGIATPHGILRIYRGKGYYRWLWALVTIFCCGMLLWQVGLLFQLYVKRPTVSQVSFLLPDQGLTFPSVTICNYNAVRQSYILELNSTGKFSPRLLDYLSFAYSDVAFLLQASNETELAEAHKELHKFIEEVHPTFTINEFFWDAAIPCHETLMICMFGGQEFDCCYHAKGILTDIGKCYRIELSNSDDVRMRKQLQAGVGNGLQIIADFHTEQQLGVSSESASPFVNQFENGFRYYVHAPKTVPYLSTEGISVSPGSKIYSAISPNKYVLLPKDQWGNCMDEWPAPYSDVDGPYSSTKCKALCRARFFNERCSCAPFAYNVEWNYRFCAPYEIVDCINKIRNETGMTEEDDPDTLLPACSECGMECERWLYHTYNSYAQGFSPGSLAWLHGRNKNWTAGHVRSNFVAMNVFFRDMSYTEYQQVQRITLTEIWSNIGGNMGLFMGMSVLSAIEVIIYVSKVTWILISKGRRNYLASKKQKEIEREQRLTETLEIAKKRRDMASEEVGTDDNEIDEPPGFSSRLRRFAGGIRRRSASVWSQHYASEPPSYPEIVEQGDCKPSTGLPDVGSFLAPPSRVSTKSRNFVDSVIEARLHGQGRAIQRDLAGEQSDDDALVELQINLNDLLSSANSKPGDNPTIAVVRPRTNSDPSQPQATLSPQAADTRHSTKSGKHRSATIVSGDFDHDHASVHPTPVMNEKNPSSMKVPGFLVRNLSPMLGAAAHLATETDDGQSATKQPARRNLSSKN